jgi:hypothetical protein
MKNAAAPAELPREYLWAFPGAPIRIHIRVAVVARLRDHLLQDYNSDPALQTEKGGLLLGTVRTNNVEITDFEPFRPDRTERNFILSNSEKEFLRITLENKPRGSHTSVVGFFRSDFRKGVQLYEDDLALAKQFFSHPAQVFLIVHPEKDRTPDAGFFFWDGGTIFGDTTFMQFPFDERLLPTQAPAADVPFAPPVPPQVAPPVVQSVPAQTAAARSTSRSKSAFWIAGILSLAAGAYAILPYVSWKTEPPKQAQPEPRVAVVASPTSLSVSQQGKNVEIVWDSQLPAIADARVGVLTIKDGDWQVELPLTKVQLQMNKLIYPPKTDQLEVTFEVFSAAGKSTREAAMFVRQPSVRWRSVPAVAASPQAPVIPRTQVQAAAETPSKTEAVNPPVRTFGANRLNRQKPVPEPSVVTEAPAAQVPVDRGLRSPDFLAPSLQQPAPKFTEPPPSPPRVAIAVQPPRPTQQVRPIVPPTAIAMLKRTVDIQVRVSVSDQGKVIGTEATGPAAGLYHYLATSAVQAARNWKFQPAQRGTTPVASEIILHFLFEPGTK